MRYGEVEKKIISLLEKSVKEVFTDLHVQPPLPGELKTELEIPKEKSHGDLSSNIAMRICKLARLSPMELADRICDKSRRDIALFHLKDVVGRLEAKEPGFINFFFSDKYLCRGLLEIKRKKSGFGSSSIGRGMRLQIEFVSANPTGPLTIAHGRQAAIGDSLANIMEFLGYRVTREYYLNDEGTQMDILGISIRARYLEIFGCGGEFPQDGYKGSYVIDIAKAIAKTYRKKFLKTTDIRAFREFGLRWILNDIKKDLRSFGVKFDVWYSQKSCPA